MQQEKEASKECLSIGTSTEGEICLENCNSISYYSPKVGFS